MPETKQAQRVLLKGRKLLGVEQVQSVVIHDAETFEEHVEELYHQCKLLGEPAIPKVCRGLLDVAVREESSLTAAAKHLGIGRSTLFRHRNRLNEGKEWSIMGLSKDLLCEGGEE